MQHGSSILADRERPADRDTARHNRDNFVGISTICPGGSTIRSFVDIERTFGGQPRELGAVLARVDTGRGKEQLFLDRRPELLKRLSENARIASITASNAIEGVVVESARAARIVEGSPSCRNRSEKEFAGYRDAIDALMRSADDEPLTIPFVLHLHRQLFYYADGKGGGLKKDDNLIVSYESGSREIVFVPPRPEATEFLLAELLHRYNELKAEGRTHPLVLIGGLVVDFLAIHPVADGNGQLARLLTTHELLSQGYGVARYVSIEQRIFDSKNTYYERLYQSQRNWHEGQHDVWPWTSYLAQVVAGAYDDLEQRVAAAGDETASKQERVRSYILEQAAQEFRRRDIERALPEVSTPTIRLVLNDLRDSGQIVARGGGPSSRWLRLCRNPLDRDAHAVEV